MNPENIFLEIRAALPLSWWSGLPYYLGTGQFPTLPLYCIQLHNYAISLKPISDIIKIGVYLPLLSSNETVKLGHRTWTPCLFISHFNFWQPIVILKYKQIQRQNIISSCLSPFSQQVWLFWVSTVFRIKCINWFYVEVDWNFIFAVFVTFLVFSLFCCCDFYKSLPFPKSCPGVSVCHKYYCVSEKVAEGTWKFTRIMFALFLRYSHQ